MNVIQIDFTQPQQHIRLARAFSRLTGIELSRLLAKLPTAQRTAN